MVRFCDKGLRGLLVLVLLGLAAGAARATNRLVPAQYPTIQAAIDAAQAGDKVILADGTYSGPGNTSIDVKGDFGNNNLTIKSASGDPAKCVIACDHNQFQFGFHFQSSRLGFVLRVTISGLTIKDGGFSPSRIGGAIQLNGTFLTLANCVFDGNAADDGGAIYVDTQSILQASQCRFVNGYATRGGAIFLEGNRDGIGSATLTRCDFDSNRAQGSGGAIYSSDGAQVTAISCTFSKNVGPGEQFGNGGGGAIYYQKGGLTLTNCSFTANTTLVGIRSGGPRGGAILMDAGEAFITQCSFSQNQALLEGAAIASINGASPHVSNCILSGDSTSSEAARPEIYNDSGSNTTVTSSTVEGGLSPGCIDGGGNKYTSASFVNAARGDLHLRPDSPAIDAGDNSLIPADAFDLDGDGDTSEPLPADADGNRRVAVGQVDMGAYESPALPGVVLQTRTTLLTRDSATGEIVATLIVQNRGEATANAVQISDARLNGQASTTTLPTPPVSLVEGQTRMITLRFASVPAGRQAVLRLSGGYNGGTFGATVRVSTP